MKLMALFSTSSLLHDAASSAQNDIIKIKGSCRHTQISSLLIRRAHDGPGLIINNTTRMAHRPYENLIDGELDNRVPGNVTGFIRFFRRGKEPLKVILVLKGDFHEDIRGKRIRLNNPQPSDRNEQLGREGTYMERFSVKQRGNAGDITAGLSLGAWTPELAQRLMAENELIWDGLLVTGADREKRRNDVAEWYQRQIDANELFYPYVAYPYIEWYSDVNGRVVLELDPSQVEVLDEIVSVKEKTPAEFVKDERKRSEAMGTYISGMLEQLSTENREEGGDGQVSAVVIH